MFVSRMQRPRSNVNDKLAFDPVVHLKHITAAMDELLQISGRGAAPASEQAQYIGTVVDNTLALLTSPANALDRGDRHVTFDESTNWLSLMQAVHRSFFASILIAVEAGLAVVCQEHRTVVISGTRKKADAIAARIETKVDPLLVETELRDLRRLGSAQPTFNDYLDHVLAARQIAPERRRLWWRFFRAMSIVRNKASHALTSLTAQERRDLDAGGCAALIDLEGNLQLTARMYGQVARLAFDFWDEILG